MKVSKFGVLILGLLIATPAGSRQEAKRFKHARGCLKKCETCGTAINKGLKFLAEAQQRDGSWKAGNGGTVVVTCVAALAMMASGNDAYSASIAKAAQFILKTVAPGHEGNGQTASGQSFQGFGNWDLGFAAIFLGEYALKTKTTDMSTKIPWLIDKIKENREANGGWGHAKDFAYKDLVVTSTACLTGLASLKTAGFKIPNDVIAEGVKYYEESSSGGTVGYSPRNGQKGWGKAGRASGAAFAMFKNGIRSKYYDRVVKFIQQGIKTIPEDHASPTLHYLFGGLFSYVLGNRYWQEFVVTFRDLWLAAQQPDGSFTCPTESDVQKSLGMDVDGMVGSNWPTAVFCLIFQLPKENTNLHRNKAPRNGRSSPTRGLGLRKKTPKGKPWLGLRVKSSGMGVTVLSVMEGSPAAKAGIAPGDLLVSLSGRVFDDVGEMRKELAKRQPGKRVSLTVLRLGDRKNISVTIGTLPKRDGVESGEGVEL